MKIHIQTDCSVKETEISIVCSSRTPEIERVAAMLQMMERKLTGTKDGETFLVDADKVLYIDTADKRTFIYTEKEVYDTSLRLYELEEQLGEGGFFRASKSCIINMRHIASLKADFNRRIRVTLNNGEQLVVSRQYAEQLKNRLGVK